MRKILFFLVIAFAAGAAQAQIKCWTDADGKRACGDTPPPGAKVTTLKSPSGTTQSGTAAPGPDLKGGPAAAKRSPLNPAEQEQDYRKRKLEEQRAAEKGDKERQESTAKRENCDRAKESLRSINSGQRVVRVDAKGERFYLDDAQIAQERSRAQELVQQSCN